MRRFAPFSQSLINQGMNQTNRIAANAANPPNLGNPSYTTFTNNNINPGGGNIMGGPGFGPGSDMVGVGEGGGGGAGHDPQDWEAWASENIGQWNPSQGGGPGTYLPWAGGMGGDNYDDYLAEQEWLASDEYGLLQQGVATNPDGTYSISNMMNLYGDVWEQSAIGGLTSGGGIFNTPQEALSAILYLQSLQQLNEQGVVENPGFGDPIEGLTGGFDFGDLGFGSGGFDLSGGFDFNIGSGLEGTDLGFLTGALNQELYDALQQSFIDAQQQAPTFAGGGGQGGQASKRLYYPGTSGGFASVGSGIGGGNNMLQDLLKGLG